MKENLRPNILSVAKCKIDLVNKTLKEERKQERYTDLHGSLPMWFRGLPFETLFTVLIINEN